MQQTQNVLPKIGANHSTCSTFCCLWCVSSVTFTFFSLSLHLLLLLWFCVGSQRQWLLAILSAFYGNYWKCAENNICQFFMHYKPNWNCISVDSEVVLCTLTHTHSTWTLKISKPYEPQHHTPDTWNSENERLGERQREKGEREQSLAAIHKC